MSTIHVRLMLEAQVQLPEPDIEDKDGNILPKCQERAIEAAVSAIFQDSEIFIDGENSSPACVFIDCTEDSVEDIWIE